MVARFRCESVTESYANWRKTDGGKNVEGNKCGEAIKLAQVVSFPQPGDAWPQPIKPGAIELTVLNPETFGSFEAGKEYFIEFHPASE